MKIVITGGTGFLGKQLTERLIAQEHDVHILDRHQPPLTGGGATFHLCDLVTDDIPPESLKGADAVIHLAGKSIFGRWSDRIKNEIYESRIGGTRKLVAALGKMDEPPGVLISASAIGYYGDCGEREVSEDDGPGADFLAHVCRDWEAEAFRAEEYGIRVVCVRTGIVLGEGGMLGELLPLYRLGLGGPLGTGEQWFSWIHENDIVGSYLHVLQGDESGPVNAVAPEPVRQKEFSEELARLLRRPHIFRVPRWALRLLLGEFAGAVLASQRVRSEKLESSGYTYEHTQLVMALCDIVE